MEIMKVLIMKLIAIKLLTKKTPLAVLICVIITSYYNVKTIKQLYKEEAV